MSLTPDQRSRRAGRPRPPAPDWRRRAAFATLAVFIAAAAAGLAGLTADYFSGIPSIGDQTALWAVRRSPGMTFLDRNGAVIATRGAKYGQRVSLGELPGYVPRAFLAAEDRRYYGHGAVDLHAIVRAAWRDLIERRAVEGGSTLTQQLARTLFLNSDPTLKRKIQEAILAARLEHALGKDRVLELYLNRTYFGAGAYGLDAAARTYFGESASALSLPQAAVLAALPNAPTRLALTHGLTDAWTRARKVLAVMREEGWITPQDEAQALASPPVVTASEGSGEGPFGYALDEAAAEAASLSGGTRDLVVRLTIDSHLQTLATDDVRQFVRSEGAPRGATQGALVSLGPDGAILALVGGLDHDQSPFDRATQARRQPGSAFKVFVYGAAIEQGDKPTDVRDDAPISLGRWTPTDYGGRYLGRVTLQEALARSINTVAVRLAMEVGPDEVAAFARRCGIEDLPEHPGPSIALGAYEVTVLNLAGAYQVFQDGGGRTTPYLVSEVATTGGQVLYQHPPSAPAPMLDPFYASRMVRMMETVVTSGTGVAANIGRPAAGKTGTSQDWRDAWFVGFTPDLLTAVWVGADNDQPTRGVTGGEVPARIWRAFMSAAEKGTPPADFPWLVAEPTPLPEVADFSALAGPGGAIIDEPPPGFDPGPADAAGPGPAAGAGPDGDPGYSVEAPPDYPAPDYYPPDHSRRRRARNDQAGPTVERPWREEQPPVEEGPLDGDGPPPPPSDRRDSEDDQPYR
ncbi:MAG TPA: PBP1A family penicillin-binding protein [Caulobacteraceae bacterium]|nr:PBP1A family penicillin-binding protein [Caulobacteraceae bacterium]